jgi:hypothetical protein
MNNSDAYRLEHGKKVTFFDCHQRFLPLSLPFRGDRKSFTKGKTVRKGPPKRKLIADNMNASIISMCLDAPTTSI